MDGKHGPGLQEVESPTPGACQNRYHAPLRLQDCCPSGLYQKKKNVNRSLVHVFYYNMPEISTFANPLINKKPDVAK